MTAPGRRGQPVWDIAVAAGDVPAPWAAARHLERRDIDSFEEWAPR